MRLRRTVASDAPALARIFDAAVRRWWTYLGPAVQEPLFSSDDWNRLVAEQAPPNLLLIAEDGASGHAHGFVAAHADTGELFLLFVHPDSAGKGVGRRLLDAGHEALCRAGHLQAWLYTHEQNARARAVYEAAGYRHDGSYRDSEFRDLAIREVRMVKSL
jgi:GNAT superfamily N-acetyltransferase